MAKKTSKPAVDSSGATAPGPTKACAADDQPTPDHRLAQTADRAFKANLARLTAGVSPAGLARVYFDWLSRVLLDSVNTNVAIRDERMRKIVFQTEKFPAATVSAQVPANVPSEQGLHQIDLTLQLDLHGMQKSMTVPVSVVNESNRILVTSMSPVLVEAADFGLGGGILELTKLAGLMFIPTTVPVSFNLVFQQ